MAQRLTDMESREVHRIEFEIKKGEDELAVLEYLIDKHTAFARQILNEREYPRFNEKDLL